MSFALLVAIVAISLTTAAALATGDANEPFCSNEALEGFSATLPDCRAYERVTPSFQNGFGDAATQALAPGGESLIALSVASFAGAESNRLGPYYKMTRTSSGWQTASISPPATVFPGNRFYAGSEDLTKSVWALRSPTESIYAQNLYLREPDGSFVKIGSMVPPSSKDGPQANGMQFFLGAYEFAGASKDLSHVYFSIINGLGQSVVWPGDTTTLFGEAARAFSLYEYSGVRNTRPALVGVDTQGRLISDCATFLGSDENHEMYNAVSADGDKAFFTADGHDQIACPKAITAPDVTEVYARLGGQETVAISEPMKADCEECNIGTRAPAQFQGASADGDKVFFTTTQELLQGAETENLYEFDFSAARGRRVRQLSIGASAPQVAGVARISEDGSHVYFVALGRLTDEPRGGGCISEETLGEQAEEESTHEGRCRAKQGHPNLYVYTRDGEHPFGQVRFLATLAESDGSDWAPRDSRSVQATPTGQRLVFDSSAPLTQDVAGEGPQVYEYDAQTEELTRISRGQNGYPQGTINANGSFAFIGPQEYVTYMTPTLASTSLAISDDGSDVMFASPAALTESAVEAAEHGVTSVYEYRSAARVSEGNVFLLSGGQDTAPARIQGISRSGANAFFAAADQLVGAEDAQQENIFDARLGGGFAPVGPAVGCTGEACLEGAAQAAPPAFPPTSSTAAPGGNAPASPSAPPSKAPLASRKPAVAPKLRGLQRALRECRRKSGHSSRKRCEKRAHERFRRRHRSSKVKGG